ncbi:glycogen debranching N-terminal domain-containing protein [Streptomyces sp. NPDC059740]|uniref:amylo-alpha-1,6-glucosidase n=1 Tax=Streptomyces sp. NPDC059740 TaxID=3346926 RepID=UPI003667C2EB
MTEPNRRRLLVDDGMFAAVDASGDIAGTGGTSPDGLFRNDARHLSRWHLTADGAPLTVLTSDPASVVLVPPGTRDEPPAYAVVRHQRLAQGALHEHLRVLPHTAGRTTVHLTLEVDADFADQFALRSDSRSYATPGATRTVERTADGLLFHHRREDWHARTEVVATPAPGAAAAGPEGNRRLLEWHLPVGPDAPVEIELTVRAVPPRALTAPAPAPLKVVRRPHSRWPELTRACEQGLADLADLRLPACGPGGEVVRVPGAGVPWFLTLFGRDALLTSLFALPYAPELAAATLPALAAVQGTTSDPARVEEPGKIVHELRRGELAHFGQVPYGRYYGSVDATPLFLVLLGAYAETVDEAPARALERQARAAVDWMLGDGGLTGHGYLVYRSGQEHGGLVNQNWKDSAGAVCFSDGSQATGLIAVAEVQGYAHDALVRTARLARRVWGDLPYADRLEAEAAALRDRFLRDFWMPQHSFPALALDGAGRQVDVLASDAGHLLWSGILPQDLALTTGRRLMAPDFFSGWGVRTLAAGQAPYHPLSYHRGSVWPHDNAVIALGLAAHGLHRQVRTLARGLLTAAAGNGWRLPEVMAGYGSEDHPTPVPYPHSCSPQAWAAATPLALLTAVGAAE